MAEPVRPGRPAPPAPGSGSGTGSEFGADAGAERTFEDLMAELELITDRLAGGELGIEAAADLYEKAERLHALAAERLAQVQDRVQRLSRPTP